MIIEATY
jgi:hypothetical protein